MISYDPEPTALVDHEDLQERLKRFARHARGALSPATEKALACDTRLFVAWCQGRRYKSLPASPTTVTSFVDAMAKLRNTPENRAKVAARAQLIDQEMHDGVFDYLRWFPNGNLADRFRPSEEVPVGRPITLRRFFWNWRSGHTASRPVTAKWARNRASYLRTHVLPEMDGLRLDEIKPRHITDLQTRLRRKKLSAGTIDRVIHSALRGMLRDAELAGYRVSDLGTLFDQRFVKRLDQGASVSDIDPFTDEEREKILAWFLENRPSYHAFVYFRFWTGTRPSEAIALRWRDVDFVGRRVRIRRSRVLGKDGEPKTGRSRRDVILHEGVVEVLGKHLSAVQEEHAELPDFLFTTETGAAIDEANFVRRIWVPALDDLGIRSRPFYNTRHTYISTLLEIGAKPLFVCRQTGTSLEMIERHYGDARVGAAELDEMMADNREPPVAYDDPDDDSGTVNENEPEYGHSFQIPFAIPTLH